MTRFYPYKGPFEAHAARYLRPSWFAADADNRSKDGGLVRVELNGIEPSAS